jgi:hypothetical protein
MSVSETFLRSSNAGGSLDKVLFKVATAPTCCLVLTSLGFLVWNLMPLVCWRSTSRGAKNVISRCSTACKLAAVSLPTARACSLNLSNAVPVRHPRQHRCCNGQVATLFPTTPSLMRRTPCRLSSTRELFRSRSNGLGFLQQIWWSKFAVHHASWRTREQQEGREDDEGKGWRLTVDVKSDLC